jgi:hypothetical protein
MLRRPTEQPVDRRPAPKAPTSGPVLDQADVVDVAGAAAGLVDDVGAEQVTERIVGSTTQVTSRATSAWPGGGR